MTLRSIALTALVIFACWYWLKSREIKERALRGAQHYCEKLSLSLLDQSVVLKKLKFGKNHTGAPCICRTYGFEFSSTGEQRYKGTIELKGNRVESIKLDPHRVE